MDLNIKVVGKFVIAEEVLEEQVKSTIILPGKEKTNEMVLSVISGGEEKGISPGDKILINGHWNNKFKHGQKEYQIIPFDIIVGVFG